MNFRVFIRTMFLVLVLSVVAFTVYANIAKTEQPMIQPESGTSVSAGTISAGGESLDMEDAAGLEASNDTNDEESGAERNYVKENVTIKISALGDVALGQDHRFKYMDSFDYYFDKKIEGDYSYFFSNVKDILSGDDLTIANLETTLSNEETQAEKYDYGNNYWFRGKPEYANILKAGSVEVANLANNHTYDYGQKGYDDTRKALEEAGIEYFGYDKVLHIEIKGIKVGIAGFNQLGNVEQGLNMTEFKKEVQETIESARDECDLVIANFHWGKEYKYEPEKLQKELAYLAIDSGADLVIGHHPHVLQPVEEYKGRYIAYSLGNFCYGGVKHPKDYDTAIYQQSFVFDSDNVLQRVDEPVIIPCSVSSQKSFNDYRPAIAEEPQISSVLNKMKYKAKAQTGSDSADKSSKSDMVRLDEVIEDIVIELRYATSNNVVGKPVYESNAAYLRRGTAEKLKKANQLVMKQGYRIKVWDSYRAQKYQQFLYDNAPVKSVFMNPAKGYSNHTRGAAVDCTLVTLDGKEVDMPSDFDDGTALAHRDYSKCTEEQKRNALILENAMKSAGFLPLQSEWWHFDDTEYKSYPPLAEYKE